MTYQDVTNDFWIRNGTRSIHTCARWLHDCTRPIHLHSVQLKHPVLQHRLLHSGSGAHILRSTKVFSTSGHDKEFFQTHISSLTYWDTFYSNTHKEEGYASTHDTPQATMTLQTKKKTTTTDKCRSVTDDLTNVIFKDS